MGTRIRGTGEPHAATFRIVGALTGAVAALLVVEAPALLGPRVSSIVVGGIPGAIFAVVIAGCARSFQPCTRKASTS